MTVWPYMDSIILLIITLCHKPTFIFPVTEVAALSFAGDTLKCVHIKHVKAAAGPIVVVCGAVLGATRDPCLTVTHALQTCASVPGKHFPYLVLCSCNSSNIAWYDALIGFWKWYKLHGEVAPVIKHHAIMACVGHGEMFHTFLT